MGNKNNKHITFMLLIVATQFVLTGCYKDKTIKKIEVVSPVDPCDSLNTDFTTVIQPLIVNNCSISGCHDAGSAAGGYILESYADISGNQEVMMHAINWDANYSPMPKFFDKFSDTLIQKLDCWISKGMPQ